MIYQSEGTTCVLGVSLSLFWEMSLCYCNATVKLFSPKRSTYLFIFTHLADALIQRNLSMRQSFSRAQQWQFCDAGI